MAPKLIFFLLWYIDTRTFNLPYNIRAPLARTLMQLRRVYGAQNERLNKLKEYFFLRATRMSPMPDSWSMDLCDQLELKWKDRWHMLRLAVRKTRFFPPIFHAANKLWQFTFYLLVESNLCSRAQILNKSTFNTKHADWQCLLFDWQCISLVLP